ncbi:MAG: alpha/beta fold hydrolase [Proteobacteria bacterium]|nr:alpha/beta fold hydrolase [Pseudomonadota bacterium]
MLATSAAAGPAERWLTLPPAVPMPPPQSTGWVEVAGARLYFATYGVGAPVLLLHGGLANADYWGGVVPRLVAAHRRVIVLDSRGHGRSTRTQEPFSYARLAADALALLDHLQVRRADVIGWSDGGIAGLELAMRHPQRLRRLFAFGINADPSGARDDVDRNPVFNAYLARTAEDYRRLSPTPGDYEAFVAAVQAMWAREPSYTAAALAGVRRPVAVVDGAHEEAIRAEHTAYLARAIPGATLRILPDVGHFAILQNPAEFADAALEFLDAPEAGLAPRR